MYTSKKIKNFVTPKATSWVVPLTTNDPNASTIMLGVLIRHLV